MHVPSIKSIRILLHKVSLTDRNKYLPTYVFIASKRKLVDFLVATTVRYNQWNEIRYRVTST